MSDTPSPTKPATLDDILAELTAIRLILAARPTPTPTAAPRQAPANPTPAAPSGKFDDEPIPQPSQIITNAGDVQIHFGKNTGVALSAIGERSLSWYATDQAARLDSSGKPYPPRPQEIFLKNAARTLWHTLRGTLNGTAPTSQPPAAQPAPAADEENVPF